MPDNFEGLLNTLGIRFNNPQLLKQAFTHRSYLNETNLNLPSNERLEFLGDTVLSFIISHHLYLQRSQDAEGDLTTLRAYLVKTKSLSLAAKKLNLGQRLLLSKGEDASGGRENPQLLANTYEALIGAVFLDQGLERTQGFISKTLLPLFEDEIRTGPPKDAKSALQEVVQERVKESPHYRTLGTRGPDHAKEFVVGVFIGKKQLGMGTGGNKQEAEEEAASDALRKFAA